MGSTSIDKDSSEQIGEVQVNKVGASAGMNHFSKAWVFVFPVMLQVLASI